MTKSWNISIYFVKRYLKSHSFLQTRGSSIISCKENRAHKIILNISGVAIQTKLITHMVLSTHEKLLNSNFEVELSSNRAVLGNYLQLPGNYPQHNNFYLPNLWNDFKILQRSPTCPIPSLYKNTLYNKRSLKLFKL